MEPSQFDELTKALATSTSRRQALKTIAATTIGGILGLGGFGTAFAKCKPVGGKCHDARQCCSGLVCQNGTCVSPCKANGGTCSVNSQCCSGNCSNGICCASGRVGLCNGTCAIPCSDNSQCPSNSACFADTSGGSYCSTFSNNGMTCSTDCDCTTTGTYCFNGTPSPVCSFVA